MGQVKGAVSLRGLWVLITAVVPGAVLAAACSSADLPNERTAAAAAPVSARLLTVRGLEEPLVPTKPTTAAEDAAVEKAAAQYRAATPTGDEVQTLAPFERFVTAFPHSGWTAAVYTNLGLGYYRAGYFSRAFKAYEAAWREGRTATQPQAKAIVDRAVGELARMHGKVGHADELEALFKDIGKRPLSGPATEAITGAHEGAWEMRNHPGDAFLCGPKALQNTLRALGSSAKDVAFIDQAESGRHGFSLSQVSALAESAGVPHRLIHREPGQAIPVPSVINWKVNHYAAIISEENGRYHIKDPTFGGELTVSRAAIDAESTGYFLVPSGGPADAGWRSATSEEAARVFGMGNTPDNQRGSLQDGADDKLRSCSGTGMCVPDAFAMNVSLNLKDTPVGYAPQKGPDAHVSVVYNQRDGDQPAVFSYSNVGPKWTLSLLSFVQDSPASPGANVTRYVAGGGDVAYAGYSGATGMFTAEMQTQSVLSRTPATGAAASYTLTKKDGSKLIYGQSDGATSGVRRVFLTAVVDPQGNSLMLAYDGQLRLTTITDAAGRVTTLGYGMATSPLLVTTITDPFGRFATLAYDASGRLASITDTVGIVSSFGYDASGLVNTLTTPYGTSSFTYGSGSNNSRFLEMTDPLGATERLEFLHSAPGIAGSDAAVPAGMNASNIYLQYRNSFYWDKNSYPTYGTGAGKDYTKAKRWHWLHTAASLTSPLAESTKEPLENRVWYNYVGQGTSYFEGTSGAVTATGRVLDDGTTQLRKGTYNPIGKPLTITDPVGRTTKFTYDTNNIDLLLVQQQLTTTPTYATLASYTYNTQHEPLTLTDAAGQLWQYAYNAAGQLTSVTDPQSHVTTYDYDAQGRLATVVNANSATAVTLNYPANCAASNPLHVNCDLPESVTDSEGRTVSYARDALDRVTMVTYPDGTTDKSVYTLLDRTSSTDRLGRTTTYAYDADRRLKSVTDPLGHIVQYGYFKNGALNTLTDQNDNVTTWAVDLQSRPATKAYADGKGLIYTYEATTSRLKSTTDALSQVRTLGYNKDDSLASITYTGALNPTPNVAFTYDPLFPRRTGMTDGNGTTTWSYVPVGALGALSVLTEDGAFGNDAVTYGYDSLMRVNSLSVGDTAAETWGFDAIGRPTTHVTGLGTFNYGYLGQTSDPTTRALVGTSINTSWSYDTNANDRRLIGITNSSGARSFTFGYSTFGSTTGAQNPYNITTIGQSAGALPARSFCYQYDEADRLINVGTPGGASGDSNGASGSATGGSAGMSGSGGASAPSGSGTKGKGKGGNGKGKNDDPTKDNCVDGNNGKGNDAKNCPTGGSSGAGGTSGSGGIAGAGGTSGGPSIPTCNGSLYSYALDPADNLTTFTSTTGTTNPTYNNLNQLTTNGPQSLAYDLNGNTTSDGDHTYKWDAENRVVEIANAAGVSSFKYDGLGRRVQITFVAASGTAVTRLAWCGATLCQKRDGADMTLARYFTEGQHNRTPDARWVATMDQLGSIRDVLDAASGATLASFDYSPYGQPQTRSGAITPDYSYAGLTSYDRSNIYHSVTRTYDSSLGRWQNRDLLGEAGGLNVYAYVGGEPIRGVDPQGTYINIVIGGAIGFFGDVGYQLWQNGGRLGCVQWSEALLWGVNGALAGALVPEGLLVRGGMQTVTQWGAAGATELTPGWVMTGGNSLRNWLMAGGPELPYAVGNSVTTTVETSSLSWPSGWQWVKGFIGQRIYTP